MKGNQDIWTLLLDSLIAMASGKNRLEKRNMVEGWFKNVSRTLRQKLSPKSKPCFVLPHSQESEQGFVWYSAVFSVCCCVLRDGARVLRRGMARIGRREGENMIEKRNC